MYYAIVIHTDCYKYVPFYLEQCGVGYVSFNGYAPCKPCPIGTYSDAAQATSCTACADFEITSSTASSAATDCGIIKLLLLNLSLTFGLYMAIIHHCGPVHHKEYYMDATYVRALTMSTPSYILPQV